MPYEIIAYRPRGRPPVTIEEIDRIVNMLEHFKKQVAEGERVQWHYRNPDTGVRFIMNFDPEKERTAYEGWNESPLTFLIGLGRPSFFGYEIFPVIDQVLKNLNLGALDPQETALMKQPARLTANQMMASWIGCNSQQIESILAAGKSVAIAPRDRMDSFWKYMSSRHELQESLGPDIFVPPINLHRTRDGSVKMSCIWPEAAKIVLPEVDFVLVQKEEKKLTGTKKISGAVPYTKVAEILKPRSKARNEPVNLILFDREPDNELLQDLSMLNFEPPSGYSKLSPAEIVERKRQTSDELHV